MQLSERWLHEPGATRVMDLLTGNGAQAYFVGGCVRDTILGLEVQDIDIATDALPDDVLAWAEAGGIRAIPTGIEHGTVTLIAGRPYEITTFREDVTTDGRRATVAFSTQLTHDARRRDFTMNALYSDRDGRITDPQGGLDDLANGYVRFIGDPNQRIAEDYLRILRFFRFYARFGDPGTGPDPEGLAAVAANLDGLDYLSAERVGAEIKKLLAAKDPAPAVAGMAATGVLAHVLPGADPRWLAPLVDLERTTGTRPDPIRRLAVLGGEDPSQRLRLSRAEARDLAGLRDRLGQVTPPAKLGYRLGADRGFDAVLLQSACGGREVAPDARGRVQRGASATFPLRAADLAPLKGPELGATLKRLEALWVASDFSLTRDALLALRAQEPE